MKRIIFLQVLLFLLVVGSASCATYHGNFDISTGGDNIIIKPDACAEDWTGSFWGECINNLQTFVCVDNNACGTEELKPSTCGETRACNVATTPQNNNNGGGGGGSSSNKDKVIVLTQTGGGSEDKKCVENWACFGWSNSEEQCGTRECKDLEECGTEELKPVTEKECEEEEISNGFFSSVFGPTGFAVALDRGSGVIVLIILIAITLIVIVARYKSRHPKTKDSLENNNS